MNGRRRIVLGVALALPFATRAFDLLEDADYRVIHQQPLLDAGRIEVIEFFYYGCNWCYQLEPYLEEWRAQAPPDLRLQRIPALRNTRWITLTRAYYAFVELEALERLHPLAYRAYHEDRVNLEDESRLFQWAARQGIEKAHFEQVYRSEQVTARMLESRELTYAYEIETTPSIVVEGRYLTSSGMAGGVENLMPLVDQLVDLARGERALHR